MQDESESDEIRILFVSANPSSQQTLDLADELRQFQNNLRGHKVKLWLRPAAQPDDLRMAIKSKKIDVVHFSGHAKDSGILMRDDRGMETEVPKNELVDLFAEKHIRLVLLNACETSEIADAIKDSVDTVIGTTEKVKEPVAKKFSKYFYAALGRGDSIKAAYAEANGVLDADDNRMREKRRNAEKRNVYMAHGKDNDEKLLPTKKPIKSDVELEGSEPFDRYYYADYLDKQISSYQLYRNANLTVFWILVGVGLACIVWMWKLDIAVPIGLVESTVATLQASEFDAESFCAFGDFAPQSFWSWVRDQLGSLISQARGETPWLDWLATLGQAIPPFMATMQLRWCVHSSEKIRQLIALKELVRNSENLTQDLRIRLHKIMDQSLKNEEGPRFPFTLFGTMYKSTKSAFEKWRNNAETSDKTTEAR